jgi:hypothetical protein
MESFEMIEIANRAHFLMKKNPHPGDMAIARMGNPNIAN